MTKMLEEAIRKVQKLSVEEQNEAAEMLLSVASKGGGPVHLDERTRAAVREGLAQARRGEFASDAKMKTFFKRHGVARS